MNKDKKIYKIFAEINITIRDGKTASIPGIAYNISNKEIKFVSDLKINHGCLCFIIFQEFKNDSRIFAGQIVLSRTIDSAYGINKYTLQFSEQLKEKEIHKILNIYKLK